MSTQAPTAHLITEIGDRLDRIERLRGEWVAGAQTGRELKLRASEMAELTQELIAAQAMDDVTATEHAQALHQTGEHR